ncbi:MAG: hypothetical protein JHC26_10720 [Thermofilum sp.]|jgi:hypothetical protein|uniref:hypothetical protein n=1 Tax=Thermofilum sp. TaxID=1961369 RepID=UPI002585B449|nr:hypothetical protein [Thermofilum sp.]MCI4409554.1 hypothetical protein [Thermofilum sp.]
MIRIEDEPYVIISFKDVKRDTLINTLIRMHSEKPTKIIFLYFFHDLIIKKLEEKADRPFLRVRTGRYYAEITYQGSQLITPVFSLVEEFLKGKREGLSLFLRIALNHDMDATLYL